LTAPIVRYEAIAASIRQARAELEASRAARVQAERDLKARAILLIYDLRNAERQVTLVEGTIIPRLSQIVETARAAYSTGQAPLTDLLDAQRMVLAMRGMTAEMRAERETMLAELEALAAIAP